MMLFWEEMIYFHISIRNLTEFGLMIDHLYSTFERKKRNRMIFKLKFEYQYGILGWNRSILIFRKEI
jgi:hypothetical protein